MLPSVQLLQSATNCSLDPRVVRSQHAPRLASECPYGLPPRKWERSEAPSALWFVGLAVVPRAACPTCASRLFPQFVFAPMGRFRQILPQPPHSTSGPPKDERRTLRSTFGAPKDERRTLCSTCWALKYKRRTRRPPFVVPQDERRTLWSMFVAATNDRGAPR